MADDIPGWARKRALELASFSEPADTDWNRGWPNAFARYIAEHEEPPVDPLLVEAREMVAKINHDNWQDSPWHMNEAEELRAGNRDYTLVLQAAFEGIKRGMELAHRDRPQ